MRDWALLPDLKQYSRVYADRWFVHGPDGKRKNDGDFAAKTDTLVGYTHADNTPQVMIPGRNVVAVTLLASRPDREVDTLYVVH